MTAAVSLSEPVCSVHLLLINLLVRTRRERFVLAWATFPQKTISRSFDKPLITLKKTYEESNV